MQSNQVVSKPPLALQSGGVNLPPPLTTPLPRSKAWTCAAVNLFAFPGLGTIMARKPGGYIQAILSTLGFVLVMAFLFFFCYGLLQQMFESPDNFTVAGQWRRYGWTGLLGLGLCALSWVWALLSSIQLLRESGG